MQRDAIYEIIDISLINTQLCEQLNITPPKGILLYGPSGTGKTALVASIAQQFQLNLVKINSTSVFAKFVGDSEKQIHEIFEKARQNIPSIIFIDDIDSLCPSRD
jgi:transitional endoplasmic reticulum ATPase